MLEVSEIFLLLRDQHHDISDAVSALMEDLTDLTSKSYKYPVVLVS